MSVNGITMREVPVSPELARLYRRDIEAGRLAIFGAERLEEAEANPPSETAVSALIGQVEERCNDDLATRFHGIAQRTLRGDGHELRLRWNPAGIVGGFSPSIGWDNVLMSIGYMRDETYWQTPEGYMLPRRYRTTEGLFIDPYTSLAMVRKVTWPTGGKVGGSRSADKPATADEVDEAHTLVQSLAIQEELASAREFKLPLNVEIGSGLDPMGIRGRRTFFCKAYVGIDKAVGGYKSDLGDYPTAVRSRMSRFAEQAARERSGQHISFLLGDGEHMPFPDRSVREIFMSNVLNANIGDEARHAILAEAQRVIESRGNVVIRANWHTDVWPHDKMVDLVRNYLYVPRSVEAGDREYPRLEAQYGIPREVAAPRGYYLIASQ